MMTHVIIDRSIRFVEIICCRQQQQKEIRFCCCCFLGQFFLRGKGISVYVDQSLAFSLNRPTTTTKRSSIDDDED